MYVQYRIHQVGIISLNVSNGQAIIRLQIIIMYIRLFEMLQVKIAYDTHEQQ